MNPLSNEWIDKAEGDYSTARREYRVRKKPNYDAVCFHAQQSSEKYLKAYLQEHDVQIPRTHSLIELLVLISRFDNTILFIQADINILEGYAVQYRYPGIKAEKSDAKIVILTVDIIRKFMRRKFGISEQ